MGYKTARRNKFTVKVTAAFSSQECSRCGHTHPDNRDGSRFVCRRCRFACHADVNAALVQKKRGSVLLRGGTLDLVPKPKKRTSFRKNKSPGLDKSEARVSLPLPMAMEPT